MTDVSALGTILSVWAHPDDESFMVGGLLAMAAANNQRIICVTATRGEAGVQDESKWPAAGLGQIRTDELTAAATILGIENIHWLDYADGGCSAVDDAQATAQIQSYIEKYQPDTVLTFAPDGLTGHDDHQAVSRWTTEAASRSTTKPQLYYAVHTKELFVSSMNKLDAKLNIYYKVSPPRLVNAKDCHLVLELDPKPLGQKLDALRSMPSQYEKFFAQIDEDDLNAAFGTEALVEAAKWGVL